MCASCGRAGTLVGRNPAGEPWCARCYAAAGAQRLACERRAAILAAVMAVEVGLEPDTVGQIIEQLPRAHDLGRLSRHLEMDPAALLTGPNSLPPVLDRFVRALVEAGATQIAVIHPRCLDCRRSRPAQLRLPDGALCGACYARRTTKTVCIECGQVRRPAGRDQAGGVRCGSCVQRGREDTQHGELLERLVISLAQQAFLGATTIREVLAQVAPRRHQVRVLAELLATHRLAGEELPFALARLVIALRATGADLPAPPCASCRRPTGPEVDLRGQRVRCRPCARRCPTCGKARAGDDQHPCHRCRIDPHRQRGSCSDCHAPDRLLDDEARCRPCRERAARRCADCHHNRTLTQIGTTRICQPCALRRAVDDLLPEQPRGALHGLRDALLAAEPMTTRRWLNRPAIATLLADLDTGRLELTHAALDDQPASRAVEHLRGLLTASAGLPADPERLLRRLHDDARQMLTVLTDDEARHVRAWLRWQVLPRLRRQLDGPVDTRAATANAKRTLSQVVEFLTALQTNQRTLTGCQQRDLDAWFSTGGPGRHHIRPFLAWAQHTKRLPTTLALPPTPEARSRPHTDPEQRWAIARRLVHDDTLDPADRVAGALVVLYAQPLVRICALTTDHVQTDANTVTIGLGPDRLELREPFATLITSLPRHRRDGVAEQLAGNWLFPGQRAGRPLAPVSLGNRLRAIGIEPSRMRQATLDQLSKELPPAMLTGILGLNVPQTVRRTSQAGGDWARYAANRAI